MESIEEIRAEYMRLAHAMQSGVAMEINYLPEPTEPKHLRTGINSAMVNCAALATLLLRKGIITDVEYYTALRDEMKAEVERYEARLTERHHGAKITLG